MSTPEVQQLNFEDELVARIKDGAGQPVESEAPDNHLDGQFNELQIAVKGGKTSFEAARRIAASQSPDARTRFEAEVADLQPDKDLVKDEPDARRYVPPRAVRKPQYYDKTGKIRNRRLSSKEKGMADSAPENVRKQFRKY